ncbi:MAG: hypothetical protein PHP65_00630 [Bacilli bacterium]|nr:hypothetical protein [Bacilli bacterium]
MEKVKSNYIDNILTEEKKKLSMNKDFERDLNSIKEQFIKVGYFDSNGDLDENKALAKGSISQLKNWSIKNPNLILEVADNTKIRCFERANRYDDPGEPYVLKHKLETAEDDRVLGIPYAQAMAGDRVYIINGKVFTGWGLYFSLSSIKSPEDYARNIDLIYNVPYLYAAILLKAQLGLGCGFDVNYGAESLEVPEENIIRNYLFNKVKINPQKLIKTAFHLYTYGNSYWALRRDADGLVDKVTILQPERLKIFLDPMTTKILFYIYLPPIIGGTTIASYPSDGRYNPNILTGVTLSYPTPIVMHPEDVCHFKINDFTEYPFGFSDVKTILDPATARLDINILAPILYKKYTKPMVHWKLDTEGIAPKNIESKQEEMINMLENMEPGSDPVTTDRWEATIISVPQNATITGLTEDIDTQIFAATGAPETYFKPRGSTDRLISEQDKTFLARMKIPQGLVAEQIEEKLIKPKIDFEIKRKLEMREYLGESDVTQEILKTTDSYQREVPKYPKVVWSNIFKQDETQTIANAIAMLNAGIIDRSRAASMVGEIPIEQQMSRDTNTIGIDDPLKVGLKYRPDIPAEEMQQQGFDTQANMQLMRGQLNMATQMDKSNRNINDVQDPSQLGGSRYAQHELKGEKGDISQKHTGLN